MIASQHPWVLRGAVGVGALWVMTGWASGCGTGGEATEPGPSTTGCPEVVVDGGGGVADPPAGPALCPSGSCNYQSQEGCAASEACRPLLAASGAAPACAQAGSTPAGGSCTMWSDECERGHFCLDGVCRKLCCGADWTGCGAGESCIRQLFADLGGAQTYLGVDLCFPVGTCDVLDADSCSREPGRECHIVDPTGAVACAPAGDRELGERCDQTSQCRQGLHCVDDACRRLCRAEACGEPSCPPAEGVCVHFDRDPPGVGECTPNW